MKLCGCRERGRSGRWRNGRWRSMRNKSNEVTAVPGLLDGLLFKTDTTHAIALENARHRGYAKSD